MSARARRRSPMLALAVGVVCSGQGGCAFQQHREELAGLAARGDYTGAIRVMEEPSTRRLYQGRSELLYDLDRGALALAAGDPEGAIRTLELAEATIERQLAEPPGETVGQWLINDTVKTYRAEPYEEIYVNVLKLVAQLAAGNVEGGATVEARRLARKTTELRDRFVRLADAARDKQTGGFLDDPVAGDFVESPLGTYLSALTFVESGDPGYAETASRRLRSAIELQRDIVGRVSAESFDGLETLSPRDVNVVAVAFAGRGPVKVARQVGPFFLGTAPLYFEIPELVTSTSRVGSVRVEITAPDGAQIASVPLTLVEDTGRVATLNHERQLPLVYARTFARAAAKSIGSAVATESLRRGAADSDQLLVQVGGALAGMIVMGATERADTRAWTFLPGVAYVAHTSVRAGACRVRTVYADRAGAPVHATAWEDLIVPDDGIILVNTWYWD